MVAKFLVKSFPQDVCVCVCVRVCVCDFKHIVFIMVAIHDYLL